MLDGSALAGNVGEVAQDQVAKIVLRTDCQDSETLLDAPLNVLDIERKKLFILSQLRVNCEAINMVGLF